MDRARGGTAVSHHKKDEKKPEPPKKDTGTK
jgi:hypothetical protein